MSDEIAQGEVLSCLLDINADALQGKDWQRIADLMRRTGCSFEAFDSWVSTSGSPRYSGPDPLRFIWDHSAYAEADRLTIEELKRMAAGWAAHGEDDQKAVQHYMDACKQEHSYVFRGNLDPEIYVLIQRYGLNKQDDEDLIY